MDLRIQNKKLGKNAWLCLRDVMQLIDELNALFVFVKDDVKDIGSVLELELEVLF